MSIDLDMEIPFPSEEEELKGDIIPRTGEQNRPLFLLGGAMGAMGGYMGPVYPLLFDPADNDREEDPNP